MATPRKGFDPLSSLFDVPVPAKLPATPLEDPTDPESAPPRSAAPVIQREPESGEGAPAPTPAPTAATGAQVDPVQLARMLAKAAAAKAAAKDGVAKPAPKPAVPAAAKPAVPAPKAAPKAEPAASGGSRAFAAPPPKKSLSLDEALAAARAEKPAPAPAPKAAPAAPAPVPTPTPAARAAPAPAPASAPAPGSPVEALVASVLPGFGAEVLRSVVLDDRGTLTAVWKAHRSRVTATGDAVAAVQVAAVLHALQNVGIGKLVGAAVRVRDQELLVVVDLDAGRPVAALVDARSWLGR